MLARLAAATVRRRRLVLLAALLAFAAAGTWGGSVAGELTSGGFDDPGAESTLARRALEEEFGQGEPNVVLVVSAPDGVDAPASVAAGTALTADLAAFPGIESAQSYWSLGRVPPLRSVDGATALVLGRLGGDEDAVGDAIEALAPAFTGPYGDGALRVSVTGEAEVFRQVGTTIEEDLVRAEAIALPITLVLLVLVFGSLVAATLPLAIGALSIVGTFVVLKVLTGFTDVSIFALNLTTALGLGLAIDYSLFVISRYREELAGGHDPGAAVVRTVRTAGRTVVFSAATVAASLAALLIFPQAFLRSFAYAGISVVVVAAVASVVVLPAMLAALGRRVDSLSVLRRRAADEGTGFWHALATTVMRRPVPIATAVVVVLLLLGSPFLGIRFGLPDDRVLPEGNEARVATEQLRDGFASQEATPVSVVATGIGDASARADEIAAYATALSGLPGVSRVDAATGRYAAGAALPVPGDPDRSTGDGTYLSVVADVEAVSPEGEALVAAIRALDAPFEVLVGGSSAQLVDTKDAVFELVPVAGLIIATVTFVLLFLMFGSLLVPAKAVVLNLLSLTATFGAMVWIFQDGNLSGWLDFTPTGVIDTTTPILMFCIAFGLSMDYEVFLLSRIKEEHDAGHGTVVSVARGLERTGRIVTAAALLIAVVFLAFATSGVSFIKLFGIGLAMAVLLDATVIRGTLVPAFMRLAGEANWWAPAPLRRLHDRFGVAEHVDLDEPAPARLVAPAPVGDDGQVEGGPDDRRPPVDERARVLS